MDPAIINWLLQGDPSIQFQTKRDLLDIAPFDLEFLQSKIQNEGWGKKFLSLQNENGLWGGGIYTPKWISTHYTLMTLMRLELPPTNPQARKACLILLEKGFYTDGGINYFASLNHSETCVTGMTLALLSHFRIEDERIHALRDFLLGQQMLDGGWNCESFRGAKHSSFHTTISTLEGLGKYVSIYGDEASIVEARNKAHEFLLMHHLFRSDKTGEIIDHKMTRLSFPPRWKYDILRALDYFQAMNAPHDPRFCDAITLLRKKEKNGKWPVQQKYSGLIHFDMEKVGQPSRMNTLRSLRVMKWWKKKPTELVCKR